MQFQIGFFLQRGDEVGGVIFLPFLPPWTWKGHTTVLAPPHRRFRTFGRFSSSFLFLPLRQRRKIRQRVCRPPSGSGNQSRLRIFFLRIGEKGFDYVDMGKRGNPPPFLSFSSAFLPRRRRRRRRRSLIIGKGEMPAAAIWMSLSLLRTINHCCNIAKCERGRGRERGQIRPLGGNDGGSPPPFLPESFLSSSSSSCSTNVPIHFGFMTSGEILLMDRFGIARDGEEREREGGERNI